MQNLTSGEVRHTGAPCCLYVGATDGHKTSQRVCRWGNCIRTSKAQHLLCDSSSIKPLYIKQGSIFSLVVSGKEKICYILYTVISTFLNYCYWIKHQYSSLLGFTLQISYLINLTDSVKASFASQRSQTSDTPGAVHENVPHCFACSQNLLLFIL